MLRHHHQAHLIHHRRHCLQQILHRCHSSPELAEKAECHHHHHHLRGHRHLLESVKRAAVGCCSRNFELTFGKASEFWDPETHSPYEHRFLSYPSWHWSQLSSAAAALHGSQVCIRLPFARPASLAPLVLQEAWAALSRHWPTSSTTRTTKRRHSHSRQSKPSQLTIRARIPTTTTPWPYALPASCRGSFATSARRT